jgi:hypothetical protein
MVQWIYTSVSDWYSNKKEATTHDSYNGCIDASKTDWFYGCMATLVPGCTNGYVGISYLTVIMVEGNRHNSVGNGSYVAPIPLCHYGYGGAFTVSDITAIYDPPYLNSTMAFYGHQI